MTTFQGALTALVTPFRDGRVDERALRDLVEAQIAGGIDGLVPCGTTGESVTLTDEEHALVVRTVVDQAKKRVPVVAGAGTVSTHHTIALTQLAKDLKADGVLLVVPYYNRPTQAGLAAHYRAVLNAVSIPAILYNIPGRTGTDLSIETLEKLADLKDLVAIKEATGNVLRSQSIIAKFGERYDVLSGDDSLTLPILAVGGKGVISVTSNYLPREVGDVVRLFKKGDVNGARALHQRLLSVHDIMFIESNPGPVKFALSQAGRLAPEVRLPLVWPEEKSQSAIRATLEKFHPATTPSTPAPRAHVESASFAK